MSFSPPAPGTVGWVIALLALVGSFLLGMQHVLPAPAAILIGMAAASRLC